MKYFLNGLAFSGICENEKIIKVWKLGRNGLHSKISLKFFPSNLIYLKKYKHEYEGDCLAIFHETLKEILIFSVISDNLLKVIKIDQDQIYNLSFLPSFYNYTNDLLSYYFHDDSKTLINLVSISQRKIINTIDYLYSLAFICLLYYLESYTLFVVVYENNKNTVELRLINKENQDNEFELTGLGEIIGVKLINYNTTKQNENLIFINGINNGEYYLKGFNIITANEVFSISWLFPIPLEEFIVLDYGENIKYVGVTMNNYLRIFNTIDCNEKFEVMNCNSMNISKIFSFLINEENILVVYTNNTKGDNKKSLDIYRTSNVKDS